MKLVTAFIRPIKLDDVRNALLVAGVDNISVSEAKIFGGPSGRAEMYRDREYNLQFRPNLRIETLVKADIIEVIVETIAFAARTGKHGDGRIVVTEADVVVNICTGERSYHAA